MPGGHQRVVPTAPGSLFPNKKSKHSFARYFQISNKVYELLHRSKRWQHFRQNVCPKISTFNAKCQLPFCQVRQVWQIQAIIWGVTLLWTPPPPFPSPAERGGGTPFSCGVLLEGCGRVPPLTFRGRLPSFRLEVVVTCHLHYINLHKISSGYNESAKFRHSSSCEWRF